MRSTARQLSSLPLPESTAAPRRTGRAGAQATGLQEQTPTASTLFPPSVASIDSAAAPAVTSSLFERNATAECWKRWNGRKYLGRDRDAKSHWSQQDLHKAFVLNIECGAATMASTLIHSSFSPSLTLRHSQPKIAMAPCLQ